MSDHAAEAVNPFAPQPETKLPPLICFEITKEPAPVMMALAFLPELDTSPRQRLDWCVNDPAVIRGTTDPTAKRLLNALRHRRGYCSGAVAYDMFSRFLCGNGFPEHLGQACYWLRIAVERGYDEAFKTAMRIADDELPALLTERNDRDRLLPGLRELASRTLNKAADTCVSDSFTCGLLLARVCSTARQIPGLLNIHQLEQLKRVRMCWLNTPDRNAVHETIVDLCAAELGLTEDGTAEDAAKNSALDDQGTPSPPAPEDAAFHRVCQLIPDSPELQRRYDALTKDLALAASPSPRDLKAELDAEFPWMASITEKLIGHLALRHAVGSKAFHLPPTLIVGHPGSGKTRYVQRLFEAANIPSRLLSLAGANDNRALQGTARGWNNAQPSVIAQTIATESIANPGFILDEIDKVSPSRRNGNAWDTLHLLLEPRSAAQWFDECLLLPCDLTPVTFIATANSLSPLPRSLLSRFTIHYAPVPGDADRWTILSTLLRDVANDLGSEPERLPRLRPEDWERLHASCGGSIRDSKRLLHDLLLARLAEALRPNALH